MTATDLTLRESAARPAGRRAGRATWLTVPVILGLIVVAGWVMIALTITLWSPYDPLATTGFPLLPPSAQHLLGTDALGRDVLPAASRSGACSAGLPGSSAAGPTACLCGSPTSRWHSRPSCWPWS